MLDNDQLRFDEELRWREREDYNEFVKESEELQAFDNEREAVFATTEFCDAIDKNGFMSMMIRVCEELKKRGYVA